MASSILNRLGNAATRRLAEEIVERGIREGLAAGEDENFISRRILKAFFAPNSVLGTAISAIPGARYAPFVGLSVAAEYLSEHADTLLPGDTRQIVKLVRHTLKTAAPVLEGVGDATADVLESQVNQAVNSARSPSSVAPASRSGILDRSVFIWLVGEECILINPVRSTDGTIERDDLGDPIPKNLRGSHLALWLSERFTNRGTRKIKTKDGKERDVPVERERRLLTGEMEFADALRYEGVVEGLNAAEAEEFKRLFAPKPSWESQISPNVDKVLSWFVDVLSFLPLMLTDLARQESEDLVQKMKHQKPDPEWVNRRLGRFSNEVAQFPLDNVLIYNEDQLKQIRTLRERICDDIDITCEGEQSQLTKVRKGLKAAPDVLRQVQEILSSSAPWVVTGASWWLNTLIVALILLILGIILPTTGIPVFGSIFLGACAIGALLIGSRSLAGLLVVSAILIPAIAWFLKEDFWQVALYCAAIGGVIGFVFTWPFPAIQQVLDLLRNLPGFKNLSDDGFNDLGRRIALFSLTLMGILVPMNWFQTDPIARVMITMVVLAGVGRLFGFTIIDSRYLSDREVIRSLKAYNWLVTFPMLVTIVLVTFLSKIPIGENKEIPKHAMTGPEFIRWVYIQFGVLGSGVSKWIKALIWWQWVGIGVFILFVLLVVSILFGKSKEGTGGGDRAMTFASILLGGGAFLAVLFIGGWMVLAGLHEIGSWFGGSDVVTPVTPTVEMDDGFQYDKMMLCSNVNTTFEQKQILKCP